MNEALRMKAENKTTKNEGAIEKFLNTMDNPQRRDYSLTIYHLINGILPDEPKMWGGSIIGYGDYHYKYESGREGDFFKIGFSPRKQNLTIYIMPGFAKYEELMSQLGKHTTEKSCLYIKKLEDVDMELFLS